MHKKPHMYQNSNLYLQNVTASLNAVSYCKYRFGSIGKRFGGKDTINKAKIGSQNQIKNQKIVSIQVRPNLYLDTARPCL